MTLKFKTDWKDEKSANIDVKLPLRKNKPNSQLPKLQRSQTLLLPTTLLHQPLQPNCLKTHRHHPQIQTKESRTPRPSSATGPKPHCQSNC